MGLSLEDINKGVADIGNIIGNSMDALYKILGKMPTSTGGIAAPTQPQTTSQPQGTAQESVGEFNLIMLLLAAILLVLLFRK